MIDEALTRNTLSKSVHLESCDAIFNKVTNEHVIYIVWRRLSNEGNTIYEIMELTVDQSNNYKKVYLNLEKVPKFNEIRFVKIITNKIRQEVYFIFTQYKDSSFIYFYDFNSSLMSFKPYDFEVRGINIVNILNSAQNSFSFELLALNKGIFEVFCKNAEFFENDKTDIFVKNLLSTSNKLNDDKTLKINREYSSKINENNYNYNDNSFNSERLNMERFILDAFYRYQEFKSQNNGSVSSNLEREVYNFNEELKRLNLSLFLNEVEIILNKYIDDDSLNVDFINKESEKAELVIIEYLIKKEKRLVLFFDFLKFYKIFNLSNALYFKFIEYMFKLALAVKLREFENSVIENNVLGATLSNSNNNNFNTQFDVNKSFKEFLSKVNESIKRNYLSDYGYDESIKYFNKQYIYSKISKINKILNYFFETFNDLIDNFKVNLESKALITFAFVVLLNKVILSFKNIINNYLIVNKSELKESEEDFLWFFKEQSFNLIKVNKRLLEYFKTIKTFFGFNDLEDDVINFAENILYLFNLNCEVNSSKSTKNEFFKLKREIIQPIIQFNKEKAFLIASLYQDYHSITNICFHNQWIDKLLEEMQKYLNQRTIIIFIMKQYLIYEAEQLKANIYNFNFFEIFVDFRLELEQIIIEFPKLHFFYKLFLKAKRDTLKNSSSSSYLNEIDKVLLPINKYSNTETFIKMAKVVNNIEASEVVSVFNNDENNEDSKYEIDIQTLKLNYESLINYVKLNLSNYDVNLNKYNIDINNSIKVTFENLILSFIVDLNFKDKALNDFDRYVVALRIIELANLLNHKKLDLKTVTYVKKD